MISKQLLKTASKIIEWLRFFCTCAVVLLHAVGGPSDGNAVISFQHGAYDTTRILFSEGLCRVAVPFFFLISGYLFFVRLEEWDKFVWFDKLKKRGKTLLAPYLIWNFIAICFSILKLYAKFIFKGEGYPDFTVWYNGIGGYEHSGTQGMEETPSIILFGIFEI